MPLAFVLVAAVFAAAQQPNAHTEPRVIAAASTRFLPGPSAAFDQFSAADPARAARLEPAYSIQAGIDGEIFPVFANFASLQPRDRRTWGTIAVAIHNSSETALHHRVMVQVPGWSDPEVQIVEVAPGKSQTLLFAPAFLPRLFQNQELAAATVVMRVSDMTGRTVFEETHPVRLRSVDDLYWGKRFEFAPYIASWVTPHDPRVEAVLRRAKEFAPRRRLPGYEEWKDEEGQRQETEAQARAIYRAVQESGVSYVKSSLTFGQNTNVSERIRMPRESLRDGSANCIDGVVLYAALFENLGMEPAVVLVPGHAYVGVRLAQDSGQFLYFDTALTGRADFDAAVRAAQRGLENTPQSEINAIRLTDARRAGIFPLPLEDSVPATSVNAALHSQSAAQALSLPRPAAPPATSAASGSAQGASGSAQ